MKWNLTFRQVSQKFDASELTCLKNKAKLHLKVDNYCIMNLPAHLLENIWPNPRNNTGAL
jgi:hypothetical protein